MRKLIFICLSLTALFISCSDNIDPDNKQDLGLDSGYEQKMVGMQFTSVGCTYCPILSAALKEIEKDYPGRIIPVAFHLDFGGFEDPMALPISEKLYGRMATGSGLPLFAMNFRKSSEHIVNEYVKIVSELNLQAEKYPAVCGVAAECTYDESLGKIEVKARFKSDVEAEYRYHIMLLEDGIHYDQIGTDSDDYVHDNVLRAMAGDNVLGVILNSGDKLVPGKEYEAVKSFNVSKEWNTSKMRVVVAMLKAEGDGDYCSNNAVVCVLGQSVDYSYVK